MGDDRDNSALQNAHELGKKPRDWSSHASDGRILQLVDPLSLLPWISSLQENPETGPARTGHTNPTGIGKRISYEGEGRIVDVLPAPRRQTGDGVQSIR